MLLGLHSYKEATAQFRLAVPHSRESKASKERYVAPTLAMMPDEAWDPKGLVLILG